MINWVVLVGLFIFSFVKILFFSKIGFGLLDEGQSLHNGLRALAGDLPYRDYFTVFPIFHHYFYALVFKVFGASVLIPRIFEGFIFSFTPVLIFLICKKYVLLKYALIPAILIIFLDLNIERLYYFTFIWLGLYLFQISLPLIKIKGLFSTGFLLGLAMLFRLDLPGALGLAMAIGSGCYFYSINSKNWIKKWVIVGSYLFFGVVIPVGVAGIWLLVNGLMPNFINDAVLQPVYVTQLHRLPFPGILELIPQSLALTELNKSYTAMFGYLLIVSYLMTGMLLIRGRLCFIKKYPILFILLLDGLLNLPYVFGRSEIGHFIKGGFPVFILGTFLFYNINTNKYHVLKGMLWILVFGILVANILQSLMWFRFNNQKVSIGNNTLWINESYVKNTTLPSADTLKESVDFIQFNTRKHETVLILPYMAGIYFLADRSNPGKFDNVLAGFINGERQEKDYIEGLKRSNIRFVIYDPDNGPKMYEQTLKEYNPLIHAYIMETYEIVKKSPEGWLFMRIKDVR